MATRITVTKVCRIKACSEFPTKLPPPYPNIYQCLKDRYVRVGANICDQFARIGGCTGQPTLWYKCGDVRPDTNCPPSPPHTVSRLGLVCIRNRPDPNLNCSNVVHGYATAPLMCK
jgi:hypothetical protein